MDTEKIISKGINQPFDISCISSIYLFIYSDKNIGYRNSGTDYAKINNAGRMGIRYVRRKVDKDIWEVRENSLR